jgi:hypothetical protein
MPLGTPPDYRVDVSRSPWTRRWRFTVHAQQMRLGLLTGHPFTARRLVYRSPPFHYARYCLAASTCWLNANVPRDRWLTVTTSFKGQRHDDPPH